LDPALASGGTKFERCERLEGAIRRLHAEGRHLVLLLDEAQDMPAATLHELRWITNFNGGGVALLTVVLIGQPELRPLVAGDAAIDQRISLRFHLRPMTVGDVPNYLKHRMRTAGHADGGLFTEGAAVRLHEASGGVPRQVNRLAKLALEHAWLAGSPQVDVDAVSAVVRDLERHQAIPA
jgi:general secretion pathway protein A